MTIEESRVLSIGSINIHGISGKRGEISHALSSLNLDILAVSETWSRSMPEIRGYKVLIGDPMQCDNRLHRGISLYYRESLTISVTNPPLRQPVDMDMAAITIGKPGNKNKRLTFAAVYNPPRVKLDTEILESLVENNQWVVFGGDFNCRSRLLGDTRTNTAGIALHRFITENGLDLISDNEPTFFGPTGTSRPDLFFTEHAFRDEIAGFGTSDIFDSDHRLIFVRIRWDHSYQTSKTVRDYKNADWELYQNIINLQVEPEPLHTKTEVDDGICNLVESLSEAGEAAIGTRQVPIINDYLSNKAKQLIKLRNRLRRRRRQYGAEEFRIAVNDLTRRIRAQRSTDYQKFLDRMGRKVADGHGGTGFWKSLNFFKKRFKTISIPSFNDRHGAFVSEPVDVAEAYAEYMAHVCTEPAEPTDTPLTDEIMQDFKAHHPEIFDDNFDSFFVEHQEEQEILELARPISHVELELAIRRLPHKAPGKDGITAMMTKRMGNVASFRLLDIMNECLKTGYFPKSWKEAVLVIILKPGKNKHEIGSYRPISLLNIFGKLFEKIVYWRLSAYLESKGFFSRGQFGFRKGRETTELLFELSQDILTGLGRKNLVTANVLFDAEKAFDKVWTTGLIYKIQSLGIFPTRIVRLFASYFKDRTIQVRVGNAMSSKHAITAGTPQGSILSPLLYNISTNDLSTFIATDHVKIRQFADDLKISSTKRKRDRVRIDLQNCISKIEDYSKIWRITFNARKTKLVVNSRRRAPRPLTLSLNNVIIPESQSAKYLGMTFNKSGSASDHVNDIVGRAAQRLGFLRSLSKLKVIPTKYVLFSYKTHIRPILEYAYPAWCGGLSNKDLLRLERLQRRAIKIAKSWPLWTPTRYLYSQVPIEPLPQRLNSLGRAFVARHPDMEVINRHHPLSRLKYPIRVLAANR